MVDGSQSDEQIEKVAVLPAAQTIEPRVLLTLEQVAREASKQSYSPYSHFPVGAAILTDSGKIYSGCNVENASYSLTNCAERTAIFKATSEGERGIQVVVVYTHTDDPTPPCGACRQVINEFGPDCLVVSIGTSAKRVVNTANDLLPGAFGPKNLRK
jgi:cytidine deaminase